jgi:hypothetical protein
MSSPFWFSWPHACYCLTITGVSLWGALSRLSKENHGKPWSSWPVAGPSECKLTSSQQSGIKSASPNISPYLCCCVFLLFYFLSVFFSVPFFFIYITICFLQLLLCSYDLDKYQTVYNTRGRNKRIYEQICKQLYIYLYLWFFDYR